MRVRKTMSHREDRHVLKSSVRLREYTSVKWRNDGIEADLRSCRLLNGVIRVCDMKSIKLKGKTFEHRVTKQ